MKARIGIIEGDGIGPEIIAQAKRVLDKVALVYGHTFEYVDIDMGGCSIDKYGTSLTDENLELAKGTDAILLGAVGGDTSNKAWYGIEPHKRPEAGLLKIRKELGLFANLRPVYLYKSLAKACPLKEELVGDGFDIMIVRELTGGLYFGERSTVVENSRRKATDTLNYNEDEIRRVAIKAFELAAKRKGKLTSVDKANVLDSSRLWRAVVEEVAIDYKDVKLSHMLVDNCAMQLIINPSEFDVILTENMFGDILSDEASVLTGSIGMLSSASLNDTSFGMYEPSHGSAPDIKGKGIANPIATIISAAMLLGISLGLDKERKAVEAAVEAVLESGVRTVDISEDKQNYLGTEEITDLILAKIN
jgi:3-isopropylmalate dehydrogenase